MSVEPKPAASLLVIRLPERQVLMGMRGAGHKFMPNRLVFPGGAVDAADHTAPHATAMPAHALRRLERAATPSLARALGIAAARELEEETGLSLGSPPALDGLDYLCRAITPEASPIRFDARFLVVDAARVTGTLAGSGELEDLRWYGIEEALSLDLAFATSSVLKKAVDYLALSPAARQALQEVPTIRNRAWVFE
jgi:8-oxo-dGTP pyrophosphatase MutT (NUDIX family)